jgi:hypothetical protein
MLIEHQITTGIEPPLSHLTNNQKVSSTLPSTLSLIVSVASTYTIYTAYKLFVVWMAIMPLLGNITLISVIDLYRRQTPQSQTR